MKIRTIEEEAKLSQSEFAVISKEAIEAYNVKGESAALSYFERIINKTFDYEGSLTYTNKEMLLDEDNTKHAGPEPQGDASHAATVGRFGSPGSGRGTLASDEEVDLS